jgi:small subunit ribosomal protein S15
VESYTDVSHNIIARETPLPIGRGVTLAFFRYMCYPYQTMLSTTKKTKVIKTAGVHDKDTGSPEVQVALLTSKIEELAKHLKKHQKDRHSRRGLLAMVADRQTHLKYLQTKHPKRYSEIAKKLELKK